MPPEAPVVSCRELSHRYGATVALDGVSLTLPVGSTTALIGPDGVGKSTLLGLIAGVRILQSGDVRVFGGDVRSEAHRASVSDRIAYMPQGLGRNLYPSLTVFENLDFIGRLFGLEHHERMHRIDHLLEAIGLAEFSDRRASQLSGGMKQKLSLCSALVHNPLLLVLDEPTTGIDPLSRRQFWSLIATLRAERPGMTTMVATAYMEEAEAFERVVVLDRGRVLADGTVGEVLERTQARSLEAAYIGLQGRDGRNVDAPFRMPPRTVHDGPPAVRAEGLTRKFGRFTAVDGVSFSIERGEIFGFLGSNGCGKTTTMKMLTGLLPATAGHAWLLGRPVGARDIDVRLGVGYMSQSFSLYEELSVRRNIELHAHLYRISEAEIGPRVEGALSDFDLERVADAKPSSLPLGQRQRLQLAVACLHKPRVLILDEPTSGVDPAARDRFWALLGRLSREDGVTIFVSTHFMSEAERCDRISLMHAGKVLAVGAPLELIQAKGAPGLDEAFVAYIEAAGAPSAGRGIANDPRPRPQRVRVIEGRSKAHGRREDVSASAARVWAFARREGVELLRDRIRLAFALLGPIILILTFGYGISFDVEDRRFGVLDRDQTAESRRLAEAFSGSRYFIGRPAVRSDGEGERRLRSGELHLLISIPPGFGRDLLNGVRPQLGFFLDGASPFRAETTRGYVEGIMQSYLEERSRETPAASPTIVTYRVETRFRYNQDFKTVYAVMPGIIMMVLAFIPSMLAALGIVREREIGSISNLYASPAGVGEFLIGKQIPYVAASFVSFLTLVLIAVFHFGLGIKGSLAALLLGGLFYVFAMTAFGILMSSFVRTQIAAMIATAIICQVPALNFSGFLYPAASLEASGYVMGHGFPTLYFQNVSLGAFAKGRSFADLALNHLVLLGFGAAFLVAARLLLKKQER